MRSSTPGSLLAGMSPGPFMRISMKAAPAQGKLRRRPVSGQDRTSDPEAEFLPCGGVAVLGIGFVIHHQLAIFEEALGDAADELVLILAEAADHLARGLAKGLHHVIRN